MVEEKNETRKHEEDDEERIIEDVQLKRHLHFWDGIGVLISIIIGYVLIFDLFVFFHVLICGFNDYVFEYIFLAYDHITLQYSYMLLIEVVYSLVPVLL